MLRSSANELCFVITFWCVLVDIRAWFARCNKSAMIHGIGAHLRLGLDSHSSRSRLLIRIIVPWIQFYSVIAYIYLILFHYPLLKIKFLMSNVFWIFFRPLLQWIIKQYVSVENILKNLQNSYQSAGWNIPRMLYQDMHSCHLGLDQECASGDALLNKKYILH